MIAAMSTLEGLHPLDDVEEDMLDTLSVDNAVRMILVRREARARSSAASRRVKAVLERSNECI